MLKKRSKSTLQSRRPAVAQNEAFRRNNVVISRSQRELAERQQSVTQRQLDKKRQQARSRVKNQVIAFAVCVGLLAFAYGMSISHVVVGSNASSRLSSSDQQVYEDAFFKSFKSRTILGQSWLLDGNALQNDITKQFPEIERVEFSSRTPASKALNATIRFRRPVFVWQDASKETEFIDKNGVLFTKNLDPSVSTKKLIKIEDQSGVVLEAGTSVLTTQLVQFVGGLHAKVPQVYGQGVNITKVIIPKSTREVQVQVSAAPYVIKFSSTRSLDEEVGELAQLLAYLKSQNITPAEYVDLRIANKAFYK